MSKKLKYRFGLILLVAVASAILLYSQGINLGLDLQGGVHLVLEVDVDEAIDEEINQMRDRVAADLEEQGIQLQNVSRSGSNIVISGVSQDSAGAVNDYLDQYNQAWEYQEQFQEGGLTYTLQMTGSYRRELGNQAVRQAREIVARRIDSYGVAEPTITVYGSGEIQNQIIVELPGVEDFNRVRNLLRAVAKLELKLVHPSSGGPFPSEELARQAFGGQIPEEYEILPYRDRDETGGQTSYLVVRRAASLSGQHLKNARRAQDPFSGRSEVTFFLNAEGVNIFSRVTEANVGNRLAIVLDGVVRSAPNITERIDSESARITGSFTPEQAEDLALVLRSGALPATMRILEERTIGPSLGRDSILRGIYASILGIVLVITGMLVVYRLSGLNAIICLILNVLILLGILAYFGATLTLPGIAGVILTIGMAVDANILIFERIKEELRLGKTIRAAVDAGFDRVFSTIMDTNVTTLVAALFLFQFGTGPVRGFAVTLAVGLLANIFTATFVSRTFFSFLLQNREIKTLSI